MVMGEALAPYNPMLLVDETIIMHCLLTEFFAQLLLIKCALHTVKIHCKT
uniref:Uncharacterized protein n=1 Tax=Arion vulgaris TaxID=1028688 RepID=A0A0B7B966_9EUPU